MLRRGLRRGRGGGGAAKLVNFANFWHFPVILAVLQHPRRLTLRWKLREQVLTRMRNAAAVVVSYFMLDDVALRNSSRYFLSKISIFVSRESLIAGPHRNRLHPFLLLLHLQDLFLILVVAIILYFCRFDFSRVLCVL